jgi:hypothetical protein
MQKHSYWSNEIVKISHTAVCCWLCTFIFSNCYTTSHTFKNQRKTLFQFYFSKSRSKEKNLKLKKKSFFGYGPLNSILGEVPNLCPINSTIDCNNIICENKFNSSIFHFDLERYHLVNFIFFQLFRNAFFVNQQ